MSPWGSGVRHWLATRTDRERWQSAPTSPSRTPAIEAVVRRGHGTEADIRRTTVSGLVDTGAALLRLPPELVAVLGLG